MDKLKMHTPDLTQAHIARIREAFPNCVTEARDEQGKLKLAIDFDQLKQELSDSIVEGPQERYHLNWPGKREALLTANAPIAKTLRPAREESVNFDTTQNLFIEGDNLEALKLLQETYLGKVKMIYIDPPYNTGNDFVYEDDFADNTEDFKLKTNQKDTQGNRLVANVESNGRFHSDWLMMIYSRLKISRALLSDDGVIFISIDDNEQANLRAVCDEIFGNHNYINTFCWLNNLKGRQISNAGAAKTYESILCFAKNSILLDKFKIDIKDAQSLMPNTYKGFKYEMESDDDGGFVIKNELYNSNSAFNEETRPTLVFNIHYNVKTNEFKISEINDNIEYPGFVKIPPKSNNNGTHKYHAWRWGKSKVLNESFDLKVIEKSGEFKIYTKVRDFDITTLKDIITDITTTMGTSEIEELFQSKKVFDYPKPTKLISFLMSTTSNNDIILDFFAGSGSTAHAAMQLNAKDGGNRKFIMVQLPEATDEKSEAYKAGYKTIAEISKERIRRAGKKIIEGQCHEGWSKDIGFRVLKIDTSNMAEVYYTPDGITQADLLGAVDNIKPDRSQEDLLFQTILMYQSAELLTAKITRKNICGKNVYILNDVPYDLVACFEKGITEDLVKELAALKPLRVVFRDSGFTSDAVKINAEQIFKQLSPSTDMKAI